MTSKKNNFPTWILIPFVILLGRNFFSQRQQPSRQYVPQNTQTIPYRDPASDLIRDIYNRPRTNYFPEKNYPTQCTQQWVGNQWVTRCN